MVNLTFVVLQGPSRTKEKPHHLQPEEFQIILKIY